MQASLRTPVACKGAELFNDEPADLGRCAFHVEEVDAVISNQRIRHGNDLAPVGGIGKHLLVAGHRGVETDLAGLRPRSAKRLPAKNGSVFKCQYCIHHAHDRRSRAVLNGKWSRKL